MVVMFKEMSVDVAKAKIKHGDEYFILMQLAALPNKYLRKGYCIMH